MQIWLSAEVQQDVSEALRQVERKVENTINGRLNIDYGSDIQKWAIITILRPKVPAGWGEVCKFHRKRKVAEFRLIIDHQEFRIASKDEQLVMLLRSIVRSLELFPLLNVENFDIVQFRLDLREAVISAGWKFPETENGPGCRAKYPTGPTTAARERPKGTVTNGGLPPRLT